MVRSRLPAGLESFVRESNRIEGIERPPTRDELEAHSRLLAQGALSVKEVTRFVAVVAPHAVLRDACGLDVRVGPHTPPAGGLEVRAGLEELLAAINADEFGPFAAHVRYELWHPFTDGNGRSGRAVWAWHMRQRQLDPFALPFLHRWYYQTLDAARLPPEPEDPWSGLKTRHELAPEHRRSNTGWGCR